MLYFIPNKVTFVVYDIKMQKIQKKKNCIPKKSLNQ